MFVIESSTCKAKVSDAEHKAIASYISSVKAQFRSKNSSGLLSNLDRQKPRDILRETDPAEIVSSMRLLGKAIDGSIEWAVLNSDNAVDLINGACKMLPVLVDAILTESPVYFEFG
jgi:hypothetical protein